METGPSVKYTWNSIQKLGEVVQGTNLIPFKAPLSPSFPGSWDLNDLLDAIPSLTRVIDLSENIGRRTSLKGKMYKREELEELGVVYHHLPIEGGKVPKETIVNKFMDLVDEADGGLVGVHCFHGLNRTGYMVARWMMEKADVRGQEALDRFGVARGVPIQRKVFIDAILRMDRVF